jgi:hypothetical protein
VQFLVCAIVFSKAPSSPVDVHGPKYDESKTSPLLALHHNSTTIFMENESKLSSNPSNYLDFPASADERVVIGAPEIEVKWERPRWREGK